jgi:hypothetical protein
MAWVLRARPPVAELTFGSLVTKSDVGIFEGSWVGDGDLEQFGPLRSTSTYGSGVLVDGTGLHLISPGHMLEGIYVCRRADGVIASNSLSGLLVAADLVLDPHVAYPPLFNESVRGVNRTTIPTTTDPIETCFHDNLRLDVDGTLTVVPKPREAPFTSYEDVKRRLSQALASAFANAPAFDPVVTISSGYDGAAAAVLARELGCRRAVTVTEGKRWKSGASFDDSGELIGRELGLDVHAFDRFAYTRRTDLPEAEFLATGFTGEEVFMADMEQVLRGSLLVSGFFGAVWWMHRPSSRPGLFRTDQSGSSLGEWRLRAGFIHLPLPCFGGEHYRDLVRISRSPEMRPWVVGRGYDKPIPRRIIEEAGVPRGTFGEVKRAASASIHVDGPTALAPTTRAAVEGFAVAEGRLVEFKPRHLRTWERALIKGSRRLRFEWLAWRVERRKFRLSVFEPTFGSLLLRWAVSVIRPRYADVSPNSAVYSQSRRSSTT